MYFLGNMHMVLAACKLFILLKSVSIVSWDWKYSFHAIFASTRICWISWHHPLLVLDFLTFLEGEFGFAMQFSFHMGRLIENRVFASDGHVERMIMGLVALILMILCPCFCSVMPSLLTPTRALWPIIAARLRHPGLLHCGHSWRGRVGMLQLGICHRRGTSGIFSLIPGGMCVF